MTLQMKMDEQYEAGMEAGMEAGIELGTRTGKNEANTLAVIRMLESGIDEERIMLYYPDEFEAGKKKYLEKQ